MPQLNREAVEVFEAIQMKSAFVHWIKDKEAGHHNNSRVRFEAAVPRSLTFQSRGSELREKISSEIPTIARIPSAFPQDHKLAIFTRVAIMNAISDRPVGFFGHPCCLHPFIYFSRSLYELQFLSSKFVALIYDFTKIEIGKCNSPSYFEKSIR
jgi:hypothetical protein